MGAWAGGPPTPVRFHDAKCQDCAGSAPTCNEASSLPEGKIGRRTVVPNVHALAMLSELKRIGSCVVPVKKQKPRPISSVHGMQLRCAPVWWKCASAIYGTQRVLVRTSDCGTFDRRALSNDRLAPEAAGDKLHSFEVSFFTEKRTSPYRLAMPEKCRNPT